MWNHKIPRIQTGFTMDRWLSVLLVLAVLICHAHSHGGSHGGHQLIAEGCGTTQGCYRNPDTCTGAPDCDFFTSWTVNEAGDNLFIVGGKSIGFVALGFSKSGTMANSDVYACTMNNEVIRSRNGNSHERELRELKGVSNVEVLIEDTWLQCSFTRQAWLEDNDEEYYDLRGNNTYHVIMSRSDDVTADGDITYHFGNKVASSDAVSFADFIGSGTDTLGLKLQKAHGSLMLIAWVGFASVGIVMARYFKPMWPDTKICGIAVWFLFHRLCMMSAATCTIAAFIIIFIHTGEYFTPEEGTVRFLHALFGTFVTFLVILNPIMALFRPHPGEPKRPIFNWAHWGVGTLAYNLAMVTICFGLKGGNDGGSLIGGLERAVSDRLFWAMIAFFIFHAIMWILFEVQRCMTESKGRTNDIPLEGNDRGSSTQQLARTDNSYSAPPEGSMAKTVLLVIYVCGVLFTISFIVIQIALVGT